MGVKKIDMKKELDSNQNILLLVPGIDYNDELIDIVKQLGGSSICYVTLNKTYKSLQENFKKNKIDIKNIIFVDAISKVIKKNPEVGKNSYFVSSPAALTEMSIAIDKFLNYGFEYLIFDSLDNLLIYQKKSPVIRYVSSIVNKIKNSKTKAIFYAVSSEKQKDLIKETSTFVDKVIDLGEGKTAEKSKVLMGDLNENK